MLNVQKPLPSAMYYNPGGHLVVTPLETAEELRESAGARLRALATEGGITGKCEAVTGAPVFNTICAIAKQIPADLIVTPTHGRTGLKHVFLGSTAERLVQHSPCPVFVARKNERQSINTILVPVDFSDCSLTGLKYAIAFAERFAARIIVLHALDLGYAYTADGYAMYDISVLQDSARKAAEKQMQKFIRAARFGSVKFETAIEIGLSVWEICEFAQNHDIDLIISATHGWTGLKHVLIGSTAEQVVRHAPCSVLVVPVHPAVRRANLVRQAAVAHARLRPQRLRLTKKRQTPARHPFPERRKTNKFRETHGHNAR